MYIIKAKALENMKRGERNDDRFGKYLAETNGGKFISSGFVCMQKGVELSEILDPDKGITMGGM